MPTGYEVQLYRDVHRIALALERIADRLEPLKDRDFGTPQMNPHDPSDLSDLRTKEVVNVGDRVRVRLDTPGPGGPRSRSPRDVAEYNRHFTRIVEGEITKIPTEVGRTYTIDFIVRDNPAWRALAPDAWDSGEVKDGDVWPLDYIDEAAIIGKV